MSPRELLLVGMKRTNLLNMILEPRTEHLWISRMRRGLALVIHVSVYAFFCMYVLRWQAQAGCKLRWYHGHSTPSLSFFNDRGGVFYFGGK